MRDDQVHRYARHVALREVGGLGQTALLVATARLDLREPDPMAELLAASYLVAGGVGTLVIAHATESQLADLVARGPDTRVVASTEPGGPGAQLPRARELVLPPRPAWWPSADDDATALAVWRAAAAASRWMLETINA